MYTCYILYYVYYKSIFLFKLIDSQFPRKTSSFRFFFSSRFRNEIKPEKVKREYSFILYKLLQNIYFFQVRFNKLPVAVENRFV